MGASCRTLVTVVTKNTSYKAVICVGCAGTSAVPWPWTIFVFWSLSLTDTSYEHSRMACNIKSPIFWIAWVNEYASCPYPCLCFPWFSITRCTSYQSPHWVSCRQCFKHISVPRRSAIIMGYPLELPRHDICLFLGFVHPNIPSPNESSCRTFLRRLELISGL